MNNPILVSSVVTATTLSRTKRATVCYDNLDCFSNDAPFDNTEGILPQTPDVINTTFRLFTDKCRRSVVLHPDDTRAMRSCEVNVEQPVKFIVHGFLQYGRVQWIRDMVAELLKKEPMTVITVDWGSGSGFPYSQAAANTRVVGAEISRLINFLRQQGVRLNQFHLIGHSLGAHIVGYAGNRVPGLRRITGLDPADPDFSNTDAVVHLDKTDADFVDIIHSDGAEFDYISGFGWMQEVGHIDFYPNGGENQPGCPTESVGSIVDAAYFQGVEDAADTLSCSHSRSIYLFTESINSVCPFVGHPCNSIEELDNNQNGCMRCSSGVCPQMGYNADQIQARGKFYLRTRASAPFCGHTQHVEVQFGNTASVGGMVRVQMIGTDQQTDMVQIRSGDQAFRTGDIRDVLTVDRERIDDISELRVTFVAPSTSSWWWWSRNTTPETVVIYRVTVTSSEDGRSIHFCGDHRAITNGNTITLSRSTTDPNVCLHPPTVSIRHSIF
ncbi:hypothetical protein ACF0H5_003969 [Mactra antiquata]